MYSVTCVGNRIPTELLIFSSSFLVKFNSS